jgi:hypothetical protein
VKTLPKTIRLSFLCIDIIFSVCDRIILKIKRRGNQNNMIEVLLSIIIIGIPVCIVLGVIGGIYNARQYHKALRMLRQVPPNSPQYEHWKRVAWEAGLNRYQMYMINDPKKESAIKQMIWSEIQANTRGY